MKLFDPGASCCARAIAVAFLVVFCLSSGSAQEFKLRSSGGNLTGPYRLENGVEVRVGESLATLTDVRLRRDAVLDAMERIIIPEVDFRSASVADVFDFLHRASLQFDEKGRGVNIILDLSIASETASSGDDPFAAPAVSAIPVPTVTFSARDVTLLEVLKIVTAVANLKYYVDGGVVMVVPWRAPEGGIIQRMYDILPIVNEKMYYSFQEVNGGREDAGGDNWKKFFANMGVQWPAGSSVKYMRSIGKLVVRNTAENLKKLEPIKNPSAGSPNASRACVLPTVRR